MHSKLFVFLNLTLLAFSQNTGSATTGSTPAINSNLPGSENVGKGNGSQFITGQCFSDADCASRCCGFNSGLCAGAVIAQTRDGGCGHGNAQPNNNAAQGLGGGQSTSTTTATSSGSTGSSGGSNTSGSHPAIDTTIPGSQNVGKGNASQFITGQCFSDADCASKCCGFNTGKCAGAIIAQTRDGGCGFGSGKPNDNAAKALEGGAKRRRQAVAEYMA